MRIRKYILQLAIIFLSLLIIITCVLMRLKNGEGFQNTETTRISKTKLRTDSTQGSSIHGVPLVIYQTWWTDMVPPGMKKTIEEVQKVNPEFDYHLFTDEDCEKFIKEKLGERVLRAFRCLKPGAFKADLWRYCVLYQNGGVYLDIKFVTKMKIINIVKENPFLLVNDQAPYIGCYWNGFMITPAGHPLLKACIDQIVEYVERKEYGTINHLALTGPCLIGNLINNFLPDYKTKYSLTTNRNDALNDAIKNDETGVIVLEQYPTYRDEQARNQKTAHYGVLWQNRDIYSC